MQTDPNLSIPSITAPNLLSMKKLLRTNWTVFCAGGGGDSYIKRKTVLVSNFSNFKPRSCFVGVAWTVFHPLEQPRSRAFSLEKTVGMRLPFEVPIGHFRVLLCRLLCLCQNESKCKTFLMKMSPACSFISMQIKVIFIRMVSHLDSLWNRGTRELENERTNYFLLYLLAQYPSRYCKTKTSFFLTP